MAHSIESPTLDFSSGHHLRVLRSSLVSGSVLSVDPAWNSLSPSPSVPPPDLVFSLFLRKKKKNCKALTTISNQQINTVSYYYFSRHS